MPNSTFNIARALAKFGRPLGDVCTPLVKEKPCLDCHRLIVVKANPQMKRCEECQLIKSRLANMLRARKSRQRKKENNE
jgi:hypothetical protein